LLLEITAKELEGNKKNNKTEKKSGKNRRLTGQ
jgi:hypothetical protein